LFSRLKSQKKAYKIKILQERLIYFLCGWEVTNYKFLQQSTKGYI